VTCEPIFNRCGCYACAATRLDAAPEKPVTDSALELDSVTISWIFLPKFLKKKGGKANNYRDHRPPSTGIFAQ
jgi:hypothetical protein